MFASRETERAMRQVQWQTTETDEATLDEGTRNSFITPLPSLPMLARTRLKESDGHENDAAAHV